ncbi:MAG: Malate dehydrogenase (oxaloacetate-decarboxylating) [Acidimicrobiales bacterium]|nr:Malate dehydrogenase (oxaloacetate-decarboxylating) [Acidimicrobiales bacterium]
MASPNPAYSVRLRVEVDNTPGSLGRLATAIGEAGGNIAALDIVEATTTAVVEDVTVDARDEDHATAIRAAVEALDGVHVHSVLDRTFLLHVGGKIEVRSKIPLRDRADLSMAYTPGVARVCNAIAAEPDQVHTLTIKRNTVAIVTDGTAVLGLGDIGPEAALPVMEGKALLFKEFAGVDAFPICLRVDRHDPTGADQLVEAVERLEPVFGGVNLEDIAAPRCFEVEERLKASLGIPVFHDDQHGTAVVVLAALRNSLQVVGKRMEDLKVVIAGVGAAGVAIARILLEAGVPNVIGVDRKGAVYEGRSDLNAAKQWFAEHTNPESRKGALHEVMPGSDVFVGVSGPGLLLRDDLRVMHRDPIVFALANPDPEIVPETAAGMTAVLATGRSDYPNQINNVLCFPGIFRGALDAGAHSITEGMKLAAADAIAAAVSPAELSPNYVVPSVFNRRVVELVAAQVAAAARAEGVVRTP